MKNFRNFIFVIALVIGVVVGFVMGGINLSSANATNEATVEENSSSNPLENKKIFLWGGYYGFALTDQEIENFLAESERFGYGSLFVGLAERGVDVVDPESGVVFRQLNENDPVDFSDGGLKVFAVGGKELKKLAEQEVDEAEFEYVTTITTSYGTFDYYE